MTSKAVIGRTCDNGNVYEFDPFHDKKIMDSKTFDY